MYQKKDEKVVGTRSFTGDAVLFIGAAMKDKGEKGGPLEASLVADYRHVGLMYAAGPPCGLQPVPLCSIAHATVTRPPRQLPPV
jgi:hypothetical protein